MKAGGTRANNPVCFVSARPDGSTSLAVGLASVLSQKGRSLVIDLDLERPEVAALLDRDEAPNIYHLAYQARLAPVSPSELESHLQWQDGLAVLPGIGDPSHRAEITDYFMDSLISAATACFEHVVIDLGRARPELLVPGGHLLWVVTPSPLGLAALDRTYSYLEDRGCEWRTRATVVLNRISDVSLSGVERFIERQHGLHAIGHVPLAADYWRAVEVSHSVRALSVPIPDEARFRRAYGEGALVTRKALESLAQELRVTSVEPQTPDLEAIEV